METVTLEAWAKMERDRLEQFLRSYIAEHQKSPEEFPLEAWPGDWDEWYQTFESS